MALQLLQDTLRSFGGDPGKVGWNWLPWGHVTKVLTSDWAR